MRLLFQTLILATCIAFSGFDATAQSKPEIQQPAWLTKVIEAGASETVVNEHLPKLESLSKTIAVLETKAVDDSFNLREFRAAIQKLAETRLELRKFADGLVPKFADVKERLAKLGPVPKDGETEANDLAKQRKEFTTEAGAYDGLIKRAEVLIVQAHQATATFNATRRKTFFTRLLRRADGFTDGSFWADALRAVPMQTSLASQGLQQWLQTTTQRSWIAAITALFAAIAVGIALRRLLFRMLRSNKGRTGSVEPARSERGAMVLRRSASITGPVAGFLVVCILLGTSFGVLANWELVFATRAVTYISVAAFLVSALYFALRPRFAADRLINIDGRSANRIFWILTAMVVVWLADQLLSQLDRGFFSPIALVVLRSLVTALLYAALLSGLLLVFVERPDAHPVTRQTNGWPRLLFGLISLLALFIVCASALGYVSLSRFVGGQLVTTGGLALFVVLVHLTAEFVSAPQLLRQTQDDGEEVQTVVRATLGVILGLVLDLLVLLIGVPLLLMQWGYEWSEVRGWLSAAFFGFQIGDLRLSLLTIFVSIAILIAGFTLTRIVRSMFLRRSEYLFADSSGVRESISTVLTYTGFVLSVVAALSYLGVSVTSIALIAGALSVGIGFGLQSIANNFVSGLILLAERPVKVGDWVVVGEREGRVQKISVRSTQIRTFDRSTVIVPNADLITSQVVNWDHGDPVGRVMIEIGVAYGTDPRRVIKILGDIGRSNRHVLVHETSPAVVFEGFGDSSLDFTLRVHIRNMRNFLEVQTDMRVAIVEAFAQNDIQIPFPQRDIHFKPVEMTSALDQAEITKL